MNSFVVIYRTQSDSEANIVQGLLAAHGIRAILSSDLTHSVFPLTVDGLGEVRISVLSEDADEARQILAGQPAAGSLPGDSTADPDPPVPEGHRRTRPGRRPPGPDDDPAA